MDIQDLFHEDPDSTPAGELAAWERLIGHLRVGKRYRSPFRPDKSPGCALLARDNAPGYTFHDPGRKLSYGIYDAIAKLVPGVNPIEFMEESRIMEREGQIAPAISAANKAERVEHQYVIDFSTRAYDHRDVAYWANFGVTLESLETTGVYAVEAFRFDDAQKLAPGIAYGHKSEGDCVLYFPHEPKPKRHLHMRSGRIVHAAAVADDSAAFVVKHFKEAAILLSRGVANVYIHYSEHTPESAYDELGRLAKVHRKVYVVKDADTAGVTYAQAFNSATAPRRDLRHVLAVNLPLRLEMAYGYSDFGDLAAAGYHRVIDAFTKQLTNP